MTEIIGLKWIKPLFPLWKTEHTIFHVGLEQIDENSFRIPLKPYHDMVQTIIDMLGFSGVIPYLVTSVVIALAALYLFVYAVELTTKGLRKIRMEFIGTGNSGMDSEKKLRRALQRAQHNSDWQAAAEYSERLGEFSDAAKYYLKAGKHDKAGSLYEEKGDYTNAASCYSSTHQFDRAADLLVKGKDELSAAMMYEKAKNYLKAAIFFENVRKYEKAATMLDMHFKSISESATRDIDLLHGSARIYEKAGKLEKAAAYYLQTGALQKAGELFEQAGKKAEAAELFSKSRDFERSARLYEELGERRKAGEILAMMYSMNGNHAEAAEKYLQAEDYLRAAEAFYAARQYQKAAETYQTAGYNAEAAEAYARTGQELKAAEIYEKSEHFEAAADLYEKIPDLRKAVECYRRAGRHFKSGKIMMQLDNFDKALEMFDSVAKDDPDFLLSQIMTGVSLFKMNNIQEACDILEKNLSDLTPDDDTKEPFYALGLIYEKLGKRNEARKVYRRILSEDEAFLDIKERLQQLSAAMADSPDSLSDRTGNHTAVISKIQQRYEILGELGRGGMGVVSHARDRLLDRNVALKQLSPSAFGEEEAHTRFLREARAASRLNHSNIVSVYDVIEDGNALYIAMEYVDGISLSQYLKRNPRPPLKHILMVATQVADGLQSAHDNGVVHRDIKPDNIMLTKKGKVKITDFGIAHMTESTLTATGIVMGTMKYMSPEQIRGEKVTAASDMYSFGVVLYEMVTGAPPFVKGDITYHHVHTAPIRPKEINPEVPETFEEIILKCLAKDPAKRYASCRDLLAELKTVH